MNSMYREKSVAKRSLFKCRNTVYPLWNWDICICEINMYLHRALNALAYFLFFFLFPLALIIVSVFSGKSNCSIYIYIMLINVSFLQRCYDNLKVHILCIWWPRYFYYILSIMTSAKKKNYQSQKLSVFHFNYVYLNMCDCLLNLKQS